MKRLFHDAAEHLHGADEQRLGQAIQWPEAPLCATLRFANFDEPGVAEHLHANLHVVVGGGVRVGDATDPRVVRNQTCLLIQLPVRGLGEGLARLEMAARKAPGACSERVPPQSEQDLTLAEEDCLDADSDVSQCGWECAGRGGCLSLHCPSETGTSW
jgi:hypothetical protein